MNPTQKQLSLTGVSLKNAISYQLKTTRIVQFTSALVMVIASLTGVQTARAVGNDNFADAWAISTIPYTVGASNADATREMGEPYHYGGTNAHSVWWTWTATISGPMQINCAGSSIRSVIGVYTGSAVDSLTPVASGRGNHLVNFAAVAGTTYRIALDSLDAGSFGDFTFRLNEGVAPPANDALANATAITGSSYNLSGYSNAGATKEPGEPDHAGDLGGKSVWWKWTAPATGQYQLDTAGSTFDTLLAVYVGSSVGSLSLIASNDNFSGTTSLVTFSAVTGTECRFVVDGWAGREGQITLNLLYTPVSELIFNGDFEAGNTGFSNDYVYSPLNMWPAGVYCVVTNPAAVHGAWTSFGDHTTGSGLMLVANGDSSPTNVVWRQTVNVATNASYLFSAWAASAHPSSPGQFFFFVNGRQEGNVVALPDTTGLWQNYSVIWYSGGASSALLEIRMLTTESYGNDFVLDDLSFRAVSATTPPPRLSIQKATAEAAVVLSWTSVADQLYQLQWAPTLATNQWFSLGAPVTGTGNPLLRTNSIEGDPQRFYRVIPVD